MKVLRKMKNPKRLIVLGGLPLAALIAAVIVIVSAVGGGDPERYQFAAVTRGPIRTTVVSTGTISARNTVQVGTQVSGRIARIHADFNDSVRKGQVLAELDRTLLENAVQSAEADRMRAGAQYELALQDYRNNKLLHDKALISDFDFKTSEVGMNTAYAAKLSADAAFTRATLNLDEATIRAPISGVVIDRAVEEGQTVAASLSAPTLFTIAEDLSRVQITAYVAESDIGAVRPGQQTTFTVAAYPDTAFSGKVDLVRLQPQTVQNVVNYVVMVDAVNRDMMLKPGMTATVTFITAERRDALLIPNAALSFRPTDEQVAQYMKDHPGLSAGRGGNGNGANGRSEPRANAADAGAAPSPRPSLSPREREERRRQFTQTRNARGQGESAARRGGSGNDADPGGGGGTGRQGGLAAFLAANPDVRILWALDEEGKLAAVPVRIGISDGRQTEIVSGRVDEGMEFITGREGRKTTAPAGNQNRGPGFGPFFR